MPRRPSLAARGSGAIGSDCASNQAVLWIMIPLDEFAETAIELGGGLLER
jgi:hypothetical protein